MKIIVAGGTGFIGQYLINQWLQQQSQIIVIGRSKEKIINVFGKTVQALSWQDFTVQGLSTLQEVDLIINLTGSNIGEKRWSKQRKIEILESRSESTKLISNFCSQLGDKSPPWFNASAVGIYGLQKNFSTGMPLPFDESSILNFEMSTDFLSTIGHEWELKTHQAKAHGARVINLRFGIVLGKNGGVFKKLSFPFKFFLGGPISTGLQPFPWIHIKDVYRAIEYLRTHSSITGPVNLVAPQLITQKQFAEALGKSLHRPSIFPIPGFILKLFFGKMADELLLNGQTVNPKILLEEGFVFEFPDIEHALKQIINH